MVKAWLSPAGDKTEIAELAELRIARLQAAAHSGARFLLLPVHDPREASSWIVASFHSPLAVVPLAPHLPREAVLAIRRQLPSGAVVEISELPAEPTLIPGSPNLKPFSDLWAVIFTSGSTGTPKGVALSGSALRAAALAHARHSAVKDATWLLDLPLYHIGGLSVLTRALFLGSAVALAPPRFDPLATAAWIESGLVHGLSLVPTTLFRLLKNERLDFSGLQLVLLGGAAADPQIIAAARERDLPLRLTYGMTEHCSQIATESNSGEGLKPLPGVELRFAGDGEILVRSPCLASGYFVEGELQSLPLLDGYFPTGDLGGMKDGRLEILGRKSDLIKSGGLKIFPAEVENLLSGFPGILDSAVVGIPDPEWGEKLCALLVEAEGQSVNFSEVMGFLESRLDRRKLPRHWLRVRKIPRSAAGKPLRAEIRAMALKELGVTPNRN
jgi:o-succinylbenzoate---CoA ligase